MNEHEIERVAAAMNQLRPDWPVKSLRTLLAGSALANRPRRDVTVALAWVACETSTHTPARVLESGPWWKAAGIEGGTTYNLDVAPLGTRCTVCGLTHPDCRRRWGGDHEFEGPRERTTDVSPVIAELKGHVQPTKAPTPAREVTHRDPRVAAARAGLPTPAAPAVDHERQETR